MNRLGTYNPWPPHRPLDPEPSLRDELRMLVAALAARLKR